MARQGWSHLTESQPFIAGSVHQLEDGERRRYEYEGSVGVWQNGD